MILGNFFILGYFRDQKIRQHRSKEWKKEQLYRLLTEFDGKDFKK